MTAPNSPRRALHLVIEGLASDRLEELRRSAFQAGTTRVEIMTLTESNSREALEKIFEADSVAIWGNLL